MDSFEDTGKFDFSAVDSLSDELKSSDSYKQEAADVVNPVSYTHLDVYKRQLSN